MYSVFRLGFLFLSIIASCEQENMPDVFSLPYSFEYLLFRDISIFKKACRTFENFLCWELYSLVFLFKIVKKMYCLCIRNK